MAFFKKYILSFFLLIIVVSMVLGCENNFKEVQKNDYSEFVPSGDADNVNLKYTDSGKIKSILISPKMYDYANAEFAFTEFPKGVDVTIYDNKGKKVKNYT